MSISLQVRSLDLLYSSLFGCPSCLVKQLPIFKRTPLYRPLLRLGVTNDEIRNTVKNSFRGQSVIISSKEDEETELSKAAIKRLLSADVVGFDTETKPEYKLGKTNTNKISLIQVATDDIAVLWRLHDICGNDVPKMLKHILCSRNILKIGHAVHHEMDELYRQYNLEINNIIDTQAIATEIGSPRLALTALTAMFCGWTISKSQQRSNWERKTLTEHQISYAATDAWATLQIYQQMKRVMDRLHLDLPPCLPSSVRLVQEKNLERDRKMLKHIDRVIMQEAQKVIMRRPKKRNGKTAKDTTVESQAKPPVGSTPIKRFQAPKNSFTSGPANLVLPAFPISRSRSVTDLDTLDNLLFDIKDFDRSVWLWAADRRSTTAKY